MGLSTRFTELFGLRHPIALAPMGGSAGGALAAAVSRGGGLGMLGAGYGNRQWLDRELPIVAAGTDEPWGVGFLTWAIDADAVRQVLECGNRAVMLSFGDPSPFVELVRAQGAVLIIQVTDLEEARQAVDLGADVIVAQGTEAGGHGARRGRSTLPFVPVVVDLVAPTPVLAAGGIADGHRRGTVPATAERRDRALPGGPGELRRDHRSVQLADEHEWWRLVHTGGGWYRLENGFLGLYVSTDYSQLVYLWGLVDNQKWRLTYFVS